MNKEMERYEVSEECSLHRTEVWVESLVDALGRLLGKHLKGSDIALWGIAAEPESERVEGSPAVELVDRLLEAGCRVRVFDPVAMAEGRRVLGDRVRFALDMYDAVNGADALLTVTAWREFRRPDWRMVRDFLRRRIIVDGRGLYDGRLLHRAGFRYAIPE